MFLGLTNEAVTLYERSFRLKRCTLALTWVLEHLNFFEFGDYEKAKSLIVHAKASRWADAEAYNAVIYYYLGKHEKMEAHWKLFLETYRKLISRGKEFTTTEAIEWLLKINPHRNRSNLLR